MMLARLDDGAGSPIGGHAPSYRHPEGSELAIDEGSLATLRRGVRSLRRVVAEVGSRRPFGMTLGLDGRSVRRDRSQLPFSMTNRLSLLISGGPRLLTLGMTLGHDGRSMRRDAVGSRRPFGMTLGHDGHSMRRDALVHSGRSMRRRCGSSACGDVLDHV